jgi:hypothetical protein
MAVFTILINGVDVTDDVIVKDAEFTSQVSGSPGACKFRLKDMAYAYEFVVGQTLTLDVDGVRVWGGWVQNIGRQYFFPYTGSPLPTPRGVGPHGDPCLGVEPVPMVPRALVIEGVDYNVLFRKRFCFDKAQPANGNLKSWPEDTHDDVMIRWLCEHNLDLSDDGLDTTTMVEYVGSPNPDAKGNPAGGGWSWEDAMKAIGRYPGAIFYITPGKKLVYTDVDTTNSEWRLTDIPVETDQIGYREMEVLYNGSNLVTDAMVWGAGQGAKRVRFKRTVDVAAIDDHGLWQVGDFRGDLWRQASVDRRSNSFVYGSPQNKRGGKDDAISVSIALFKPYFGVAQKVDFTSNVYGYADVLPIRRMRITFPTTHDARFDLVLSHSIDEPWNTFEYWFPKIKVPPIVIPHATSPYCPVLNYPHDNPPLADFYPVFMDDFERETLTQPVGQNGRWVDIRYGADKPPEIEGGAMVYHGSPSIWPNAALLDIPIGGAVEIIAAVDTSAWAPGHDYWGDSFGISSGSVSFSFGFQYSDMSMSVSGGFGQAGQIDVPDFDAFIGMLYCRLVVFPDQYVGLKVWRADGPEPYDWSITAQTKPGVNGAYQLFTVMMSDSTRLEDITILANKLASASSVAVQIGGGDSGYDLARLLDDNGWSKTWPFSDPMDGYVYAISWGTESESNVNNTVNPSHSVGIAFGYFGSDHGGGAPSNAEQVTSSFGVGTPVGLMYGGSFSSPQNAFAPSRVKLKGKVWASISRSKGIDTRDLYLTEHNVSVVVIVVPFANGTSKPYWMGDPYWSALGRWIFFGEFRLVSEGGPVGHDFESEFDYSEYAHPYGEGVSEDMNIEWTVAVWDPLSKLRELDPRGGPFMIPNTGSIQAWTSDVELSATWDLSNLPGTSHFCVPNASGGSTTEQRFCEAVPIDLISLHELYINGQQWSVQLQNAYQPGTVNVTVDGTEAKSALDFIESSPAGGVITFLNSFLNAKEITVCYFLSDDPTADPPSPYGSGPGGPAPE